LYLQVVASFLSQASGLGLNVSTIKFVPGMDDSQAKEQLVNTVVTTRLAVTLVVSGLAWLLRPLLFMLFDSPVLADLFVLVPLLFAVDVLNKLSRAILQAFMMFRHNALLDTSEAIVNFILLVIFMLVLDFGIWGFVAAKVVAVLFGVGFTFVVLPMRKRFGIHWPSLRRLLRFGLPLQANDIMTFVFMRIDTLLIGPLLGPAEVAYYEVARKIPEALETFYEAFRTVFLPFAARLFDQGEKKKSSQMINHSNRVLGFVGVLATLVAVLFGEEIITLLASDKYLPSVPVFSLLMFAFYLTLIDSTMGYSLIAIGDSGRPAMINVVHMVFSLVANVVLIPLIGIRGAAMAIVGGYVVANPLYAYFLRRHGVDLRVRAYLTPLVILGVHFGAIQILEPTGWLQKGAFLVVFVISNLLLSVIRPHDLALITHELRELWDRVWGARHQMGVKPSK
jgi:O-antigen/teichoic acid export membrane protein